MLANELNCYSCVQRTAQITNSKIYYYSYSYSYSFSYYYYYY